MNNTITKVLVGIVTIGLVTALVLPGRQTATVIQSAGTAFNGALGTAITG
jgi:hypothetical protein